MQNEITSPQKLLDEKGNIINPGYCKKFLYQYNRDNVAVKSMLVKEWDYYYIANSEFALCLTMSDMGYIGALSASVIFFKEKEEITRSATTLFPVGRFKMPVTSEYGSANNTAGNATFNFENRDNVRNLKGKFAKFSKDKKDLIFNITISKPPEESMVIATPFQKEGRFYLNQKINAMTVSGNFSVGDKTYVFEENDSLATLDWGRGVWTYSNTWYWASLSCRLADNSKFGLNFGCGFGNNDFATENMLFYCGKAHKLNNVRFLIPGDDEDKPRFMENWRFFSDDKRVDLSFEPIIDRYAPVRIGVISMVPHQVFGYYSGTCVLDDGKTVVIERQLGFAEKVSNRW